jgi:hypothetical protein
MLPPESIESNWRKSTGPISEQRRSKVDGELVAGTERKKEAMSKTERQKRLDFQTSEKIEGENAEILNAVND